MASMLDALKRIEARAPRDRPAEQPCAPPPAAEPDPPPSDSPSSTTASPRCPPPSQARVEETDRRGWDLAELLARPTPKRDRPYRDLAANILSQLKPEEPSALLFAAASAGPDKTPSVLVKSLAAVLAGQVRGDVLAVDLDLRRPTLADEFHIQAERGLADVLLETAAWQDVVRPSGVEGLSVLPGRESPAADATAFGSLRPARLLDQLRRHYRLVLLDAGALRPQDLAPWTRSCEATYLVLNLGQTSRRAARQAVRTFERAGGRVLGSVLSIS